MYTSNKPNNQADLLSLKNREMLIPFSNVCRQKFVRNNSAIRQNPFTLLLILLLAGFGTLFLWKDATAQYARATHSPSIGDKVWLDSNANGLQDNGEQGLPDVIVTLYDSADNLIATTTTDTEGLYLFENVEPGSYALSFQAPTGHYFSENDIGHDDTVDSDFNPITERTDAIALDVGEADSSWDVGLFAPPLLSLIISDNDATARPGDRLSYTLSYINEGAGVATGTTILMVVPEFTYFDASNSTAGWQCREDGEPNSICEFDAGAVETNGTGVIEFTVLVAEELPDDLGVLYSQAIINDDGSHGSLPCACPPAVDVTPVIPSIGPPTAIELLSFTVVTDSDGINVRWVTGAEFDSWGFYLYRSANGNRAEAIRVNNDMIPSQGGDGNEYELRLTYEYTDSSVVSGVAYTYWLVEVDADGQQTEYGPVSTELATSQLMMLYLPIIQ